MNIFGLVSLLIVIALAALWASTSLAPSLDEEAGSNNSSYEEAINSAYEAVGGKTVEVYAGVTVPVNIESLDLSGKSLTGSLKAEISKLTNLKNLDISNNDFTGLPAEIGRLNKLEVLNLNNNPLTGLPNELANLKNLRVLNLSRTNYSQSDLEVIRQGLPESVQIITE